MSEHGGRFWISYGWYAVACTVCVVGGFVVGRWA